MSKGGGGSQTVTQKSDPWGGQQPYLLGGTATGGSNAGQTVPGQFPEAARLYGNGSLAPAYFPGQTVANQSPYTTQAQTLLAQRATNGSPVTTASQNQITDTLNGKYLSPTNNPGFSQALTDLQKAYSTGTAAQTDAAFNRSGAYGGSAYDETKQMQNKAYGDSLNTLAGNMYEANRGQQLSAASLAPQIAGQDYTNIGQLANAGQSVDAHNQDLINSNVDRYNYTSNLPANALRNYVGLIGGNYGGTSTQTQPTSSNGLATGLGLGAGILGATGGFGTGGLLSTLGGAATGLNGPLNFGALLSGLPWSDVRTKRNIEYVGEENDIPIFEFNYIHGSFSPDGDADTRYRGVMAQNVMHTHPEAVVVDDHGLLHVNYTKLGVEFRRTAALN